MASRAMMLSLLALVLGLFVVASGKAVAADPNTHEGTFVSAKGDKEFTMADKDKKEHTHTLADNAKIIGADGKDVKLADLKKGQRIRVTTKEGDAKTATKVEALKDTDK